MNGALKNGGRGEQERTSVSMTLRARTPVCGPRTDVVNRLSRLRRDGRIAAFEVETWPDELVLSETDGESPIVETFERFEQWATDRNLSVRPAFDVRTVSSLIGGRREILTLPMMSLSVSADDELVGVFPCTDGDRTWTVTDCLDAYAEGVDPLADVESVHP
jgi:hypothetical protein